MACVVVVLVGLVLTGVASIATAQRASRGLDQRAEAWRDQAGTAFRSQLRSYGEVLEAASAFYASSNEVSPAEFDHFVATLGVTTKLAGTRGLGFIQPVAWEDRATLAGHLSASGAPLAEVSGQPRQLAVVALSSFDPTLVGAELTAEPNRRAALERSRDTGQVSMTQPVVQLSDRAAIDRPWSFVLYAPVYRGDHTPSTVAGRQANLVGWMSIGVRVRDFLAASGLEALPVDVAVFSGQTASEDDVVYATGDLAATLANPRRRVATVKIDGQSWSLAIAPTEALGSHLADTLMVAGLGLALTLALAAVTWTRSTRRLHLEHRVAEAVASQEAANFELARETSFQRALVSRLQVGVLAYGEDMRLRSANAAAETFFGGDVPRELQGISAYPGMVLEDEHGALLPVDETKVGHALRHDLSGLQLTIPDGRGGTRTALVAAGPVIDAAGVRHGMVATLHDVTELKAAQARLEALALSDSLTGLPNRVLMEDRIGRALARTTRHEEAHVGVFFLDLDRFKGLNDTLGHAAGDALLRAVGARLSAVLRESDTAARFGGDEFVVCCEDLAGEDDAAIVAARLRTSVKQACAAPELLALGLDVSVGWVLSGAGDDVASLLGRADEAMYVAKRTGRDVPHTVVITGGTATATYDAVAWPHR